MIFQSKMNYNNFDSQAYRDAEDFIKLLPLDSWIQINQIPDKIRFTVIDIIDNGYRGFASTAINETSTCILVTRKSINKVLLNARVIDLKIVKELQYCYDCCEFKRIDLFFKNANICKECYNQKRACAHKTYNPIRGSKHDKAKLTETDIIKIRKNYDNSRSYCTKTAKEYNVTYSTILFILHRRTWKHVL